MNGQCVVCLQANCGDPEHLVANYQTDLIVAVVVQAARYRRIRSARRFVGMLETVTMHAQTNAEYDAGVDMLPSAMEPGLQVATASEKNVPLTFEELNALPPTHPRRCANVLDYIKKGADAGLGVYEWETVKAALAAVAGTTPIPTIRT